MWLNVMAAQLHILAVLWQCVVFVCTYSGCCIPLGRFILSHFPRGKNLTISDRNEEV